MFLGASLPVYIIFYLDKKIDLNFPDHDVEHKK